MGLGTARCRVIVASFTALKSELDGSHWSLASFTGSDEVFRVTGISSEVHFGMSLDSQLGLPGIRYCHNFTS